MVIFFSKLGLSQVKFYLQKTQATSQNRISFKHMEFIVLSLVHFYTTFFLSSATLSVRMLEVVVWPAVAYTMASIHISL